MRILAKLIAEQSNKSHGIAIALQWLGRLVLLVGSIGIWSSLAAAFYLLYKDEELVEVILCFVAIAVFFLISQIGASIERTGRKYFAKTGEKYLIAGGRPPVLYLRSFSDDPITEASSVAFLGTQTQEEQIVEALSELGPVVAKPHASPKARRRTRSHCCSSDS